MRASDLTRPQATASANGPMMSDAFICHAPEDREFAQRLSAALRDRGKTVADVDLGRSIESSDAFVFVLSPESAASEECLKALGRADGLNKRIIPVAVRQIAATGLPRALADRQQVCPVTGERLGARGGGLGDDDDAIGANPLLADQVESRARPGGTSADDRDVVLEAARHGVGAFAGKIPPSSSARSCTS